MTATKLIQIAETKGITIGRKTSNIYTYGYVRGGQFIAFDFHGTWAQFAKFIRDEVAPQFGD